MSSKTVAGFGDGLADEDEDGDAEIDADGVTDGEADCVALGDEETLEDILIVALMLALLEYDGLELPLADGLTERDGE